MTLGNAFIAIRQENNRLFPDRPVSERKIALSTGVMNVAGSAVGGVPMCHGAGGMAGHVAFGARTGGAVVILGVLLVGLALFLGSSVETLLRLLAPPVLGVILFLTGAQLALGSCDFPKDKGERFITLVTAAFSVWNVGSHLSSAWPGLDCAPRLTEALTSLFGRAWLAENAHAALLLCSSLQRWQRSFAPMRSRRHATPRCLTEDTLHHRNTAPHFSSDLQLSYA